MPELPEVETIARGVDARVRGDQIVEAWFGSHREPFKTSPARQAGGLRERRIVAVHRTGKHIVVELGPRAADNAAASSLSKHDNEIAAQWIVHLGMTGRLLVTSPEVPLAKHTHARLTLASGRELRFVDPRRFGRLEFLDLRKARGLTGTGSGLGFAAKGAEPLEIGPEEFAKLFRGRKLAVKAALLNQTLMAGVGNIYADESLFRAGIRPRRRVGLLTRAELEKLRLALREVLEHAIRLGGSSVSDYVDAEGARGFFQLEHCVYQRTGEPCRTCGEMIKRIVVAGRSTHYCPRCQK
jgi:formamidopyrimidine-DNA glycosylase